MLSGSIEAQKQSILDTLGNSTDTIRKIVVNFRGWHPFVRMDYFTGNNGEITQIYWKSSQLWIGITPDRNGTWRVISINGIGPLSDPKNKAAYDDVTFGLRMALPDAIIDPAVDPSELK